MTPISQYSQTLSNALAITLDTIAKPFKYVFGRIVTICKSVKSFFSSLMKRSTPDKKQLEEMQKKYDNLNKILTDLSLIIKAKPTDQTLANKFNSKSIGALESETAFGETLLAYIQNNAQFMPKDEEEYANTHREFTQAVAKGQDWLDRIKNIKSDAFSGALCDDIKAVTKNIKESKCKLIESDRFMTEMIKVMDERGITSG